MDAISAAASIVTLIQLSSKIVGYVTAIADSSKSQRHLLQAVRNCELVLQQLKNVASECTEGTAWVATIGATLERLRHFLNLINEKVKPREGIGKAWRLVKWPFDEKELDKILIAIEREKTNLQLIAAKSNYQLGLEIRSILNENKDRHVALSEVVRQSSTNSQGLFVDLRNDLAIIRNDLSIIMTTQPRLESLPQPRSNGEYQEAVYNTHHPLGSPRFLQQPLVAGMGRLTISQTKTSFTMEAQNMQDIIYPLMSLIPALSKILPHLVDGGEMNLTEADVAWLKDEFEELLGSAHFASAGRHAEQVERAQTWHSMDENVAPGSKRKRKVQDEAQDKTGTSSNKRHKHPVYSSLCSSRTDKHNSRRYETPTGSLLVRTELRQGGMVLTICFSFTPGDNIPREYRTGFATVFRRYLGKQSIERCLTTFRVVEWEGSAFEAVANGDLRGLQTLLSKRTVFPTDRLLEDGNTLIGHACREVQLPICEFLVMSVEGTDPCETDSEGMNALRLLVQGFQDEELLVTEVTEQDERQRVVLALVQRGCLEDESWPEREAEDGCLHLSGFLEQLAYPTDELSGMVSTFITRGAGLEIRDLFGKTPLLDDLSIPGELGLEIVDKLLERGADIKAVDNNGNGVFHLVLEACQNSPDDLGKRLQLMMKHSFYSDLSRTNDQGYTPSDFALTPQLWPIWCRTIREKIPLETLLARDSFAKTDYQDQMSRPKKPKSQKAVSKLDLVRREVHQGGMAAPTPASLESDIHHKTPNQQCLCNVVSMPFVRWEAQDTPGQQLPGLPRCLDCGGYILPADMENRKRVAIHTLCNPMRDFCDDILEPRIDAVTHVAPNGICVKRMSLMKFAN